MKIAIASGKGGTGKTFVSTNLFWTIQEQGEQIVLVDCDAEAPNVGEFLQGKPYETKDVELLIPKIDKESCVFCGKCFDYCSYNAIFYLPDIKMIQLTEELCHSCGACAVACKHGAITEQKKKVGVISKQRFTANAEIFECRTEIGTHSSVPVIKKGIQAAEDKSLILLDSPPGISCPFISTVEDADYVVLVTEPTPFGLNDLRLSVETLRTMDKPMGVVINRAGLGDNKIYEWLSSEEIPVLMKIPFDKRIAQIYSEGNILAQKDKKYQEAFLALWSKIKEEVEA